MKFFSLFDLLEGTKVNFRVEIKTTKMRRTPTTGNTVTEGEKSHIPRLCLIKATSAAATQVRNMCHAHLNLENLYIHHASTGPALRRS
jgi:hypothetical protein